jgi:hypothetical protein
VKITRRTSLARVAMAVGAVLRRRGIRAVLTGGACASLHSRGRYLSADADFVLDGEVRASTLDDAMAELGFVRDRDRYVHPKSRFFVEFPSGPLAIGDDSSLRPVVLRREGGSTLALSATDSCRDRLAAFYHWSDRQALAAAVEIALVNRVNLATIRRWSAKEGAEAGFAAFLAARRSKSARRRTPG